METLLYLNIITFAGLSLAVSKNQAVIAYISVSFTALLLLCVIGFHLFNSTGLLIILMQIKTAIVNLLEQRHNFNARQPRLLNAQYNEPLITHSSVDISRLQQEEQNIEVDNGSGSIQLQMHS